MVRQYDDLSRRVREAVESRGIRKSWVAQRIGITPTRLSSLLCGRSAMLAGEYLAICELLQLDPIRLAKGDET